MGRGRGRSGEEHPRGCAALVDEAGGDGASFAVLAPLRGMDRVESLIEAGVTDFLAHVRGRESYTGAHDAYSELVATLDQTVGLLSTPPESGPKGDR